LGISFLFGIISIYGLFRNMSGVNPSQRFAPFWLAGPMCLGLIPLLFFIWWNFGRGDLLPFATRRCMGKAETGDPEACFRLGQLYLNGEGSCPKDAVSAQLWIRRAAQADYAQAAIQLAQMLHSGLGGPKNLTECEVWLKRARSLGHPEAESLLTTTSRERDS
jgi:hypothetical protein